MVIDKAIKVHILDNQAIKIHFERLYRLVPYERSKCISIRHILNIILYTRLAGDAREVLEDPSLKSVGKHESSVRSLKKCNENDTKTLKDR